MRHGIVADAFIIYVLESHGILAMERGCERVVVAAAAVAEKRCN